MDVQWRHGALGPFQEAPLFSGDIWMYPYQRTLMGNLKTYIVGIYGLYSPRIPREHNKYHGYTVRGTPNCPLIFARVTLLPLQA